MMAAPDGWPDVHYTNQSQQYETTLTPEDRATLGRLHSMLSEKRIRLCLPDLDMNRYCEVFNYCFFDTTYTYPLWAAIALSNTDEALYVCEVLLEHGARVDVRVAREKFTATKNPTTLHRAFRARNLDLMKLLYKYIGCRDTFLELMSIKNYLGQSPCWMAVEHGSTELIKWLIETGCDFGETDASGESNLVNAIKSNTGLVTQVLPHNEQSLQFTDFDKYPLLQACYKSKALVVIAIGNYLFQKGMIKRWEALLFYHCTGLSARLFSPECLGEGALPLEIMVPIVCMSCRRPIIEAYFTRLHDKHGHKFISELLSRITVQGKGPLQFIHGVVLSYHRSLKTKLPVAPILDFIPFKPKACFSRYLMKIGVNSQDVASFSEHMVNCSLDNAAVILAGGLQLHDHKPQVQVPEHEIQSWVHLLAYADVNDYFLYVLWASGHEKIVCDFLKASDSDLNTETITRSGQPRRPLGYTPIGPLLRVMGNYLVQLGARNWFIRGEVIPVGNVPALHLQSIQNIRKALHGHIFQKMYLSGLPNLVKENILLGADYDFSTEEY